MVGCEAKEDDVSSVAKPSQEQAGEDQGLHDIATHIMQYAVRRIYNEHRPLLLGRMRDISMALNLYDLSKTCL